MLVQCSCECGGTHFARRNLEWQRGRPLGKGTFGEVFEATMKLTGAKMAVKCIPLKTDVDENSLLGEVKVCWFALVKITLAYTCTTADV